MDQSQRRHPHAWMGKLHVQHAFAGHGPSRNDFAKTSCCGCNIQETECETILRFPQGQFDPSDLSVNIVVDDIAGQNVLHVRGNAVERFFVIGNNVDMDHLSSRLDDGVFTIVAPKHVVGNSPHEPSFKPTKFRSGYQLLR